MPPAFVLPAPTLPFHLHISMPPAPNLQVSVVVPVRDEANCLPHALRALACQTDARGVPIDPTSYEVLVLANNCRDRSAALARAFARQHPQMTLHVAEVCLPPEVAHIGTARRLAMDEACRRLHQVHGRGGIVASTDGDVEVAPDWLLQTLRAFAQGAEAVGGSIRTRIARTDDPDARRYAQRDRIYQHGLARLESLIDPSPHDPWPCHHQFFGGSLALTAELYCRAGGLPALPCLEDMALARTLTRLDARVRHSPKVRVRASARQTGRTALGLAVQLREWGVMGRAGVPHCVQQPQAVAVRLRARACLRRWRHMAQGQPPPSAAQVDALAAALAVPCALLHAGLTQWQRPLEDVPFGEVWDSVMEHHREPRGAWARRWPLQEIGRALPELKAQIEKAQIEEARLACCVGATG